MVYHCFTDVRIWASLGKARITKLVYNFRRDLGLHNCAVADKGSIDEYYRDLDKAEIKKIARLHNCAVADITPQLWHDVTPQLRSSAKRKDGGTNMMITCDVTPQQRDG